MVAMRRAASLLCLAGALLATLGLLPARALVEKLATDHPTVVAEMGWPSAWRPPAVQAFVTTHGASHANGAALAALLRG